MASARLVNVVASKAFKSIQYSRLGFLSISQSNGSLKSFKPHCRRVHTTHLLSERLFTKDHEWISIENGIATFGITDYAQEKLGEVVFCELPEVGVECDKDDVVAVVESVKAASDIFAPVSGEVTSANEILSTSPGIINTSPEDEAWIAKIKMTNDSDKDGLLNESDYKKLIVSLE
ncbi:glycine cleavage system H protein-like [Ciona intestinalis]